MARWQSTSLARFGNAEDLKPIRDALNQLKEFLNAVKTALNVIKGFLGIIALLRVELAAFFRTLVVGFLRLLKKEIDKAKATGIYYAPLVSEKSEAERRLDYIGIKHGDDKASNLFDALADNLDSLESKAANAAADYDKDRRTNHLTEDETDNLQEQLDASDKVLAEDKKTKTAELDTLNTEVDVLQNRVDNDPIQPSRFQFDLDKKKKERDEKQREVNDLEKENEKFKKGIICGSYDEKIQEQKEELAKLEKEDNPTDAQKQEIEDLKKSTQILQEKKEIAVENTVADLNGELSEVWADFLSYYTKLKPQTYQEFIDQTVDLITDPLDRPNREALALFRLKKEDAVSTELKVATNKATNAIMREKVLEEGTGVAPKDTGFAKTEGKNFKDISNYRPGSPKFSDTAVVNAHIAVITAPDIFGLLKAVSNLSRLLKGLFDIPLPKDIKFPYSPVGIGSGDLTNDIPPNGDPSNQKWYGLTAYQLFPFFWDVLDDLLSYLDSLFPVIDDSLVKLIQNLIDSILPYIKKLEQIIKAIEDLLDFLELLLALSFNVLNISVTDGIGGVIRELQTAEGFFGDAGKGRDNTNPQLDAQFSDNLKTNKLFYIGFIILYGYETLSELDEANMDRMWANQKDLAEGRWAEKIGQPTADIEKFDFKKLFGE